ncbi:hypothetical protein GCM10028819_39500 [Spirosoma humi]
MAQIEKQSEYLNFEKAKTILDRAVNYSGLQSDSLNIGISASGMMHESGHFATPDERVDMPESYTLRLFNGINNFFIDGEVNYRGQTLIRQLYVKQDSIFYRDHFSRNVNRASLTQRISLYDEILTLHPVLILNIARLSLPSLRYLGKSGLADLVSFSANQTTFTLHILPTGQVTQVSYLATHDYYGDNTHRYDYLDYKSIAGYKLPTRFTEYEFGAVRKEQTFTYDLNSVAVLPANQVCPGCLLIPKKNEAEGVTVKSLGSGLYAVDLNDYNNRSLFLIGDRGITVFEAPKSYKASLNVIEAVKKTAGGKPITHLFVSHHHPDHAGGLRAFVEEEATIITTKGNTDFFSRFVNYSHRLEGRKEGKVLKPSFQIIDSLQTFDAGMSEPFTVYFVGDTQHTKEYLLAYFPNQKILFQGDLCFFKLDGESAASVREQAVGKLVSQYKLDVEKIYGSWPLRGYKEFGTKADLDRKLELATK